MLTDRKFPHKAHRFGRLVLTTVVQATTRRLIDRCWTHDADGNAYIGWAIHLRPWRRNRHGEILMGRALVIGWRR